MAVENTSIEVYRANLATPEDIPTMRFWVQSELVKIQSGFVSADEVLTALSALLDELVETGGLKGDPGGNGRDGQDGIDGADSTVPGPAGEDGADATAADLIDDNRELHSKTWSSYKIAGLLAAKVDNPGGVVSAVNVTTDYSVPQTSNPQLMVCENTVPITVTLPPMAAGMDIMVVRNSTGAVTVDGGGELIFGAATQILPLQYDSLSIMGGFAGKGWLIV